MIVIADDITGAAEMAGIAHTLGYEVRLTIPTACVSGDFLTAHAEASATVQVIATDTRSMTALEAEAETRRLANAWRAMPSPPLIYKKTDSALRGHVVAELSALMQALHIRRAVYVPANPSKGRIVRAGIYYINQVPIAETNFAFDPEFPARTSSLAERFPDAAAKGIVMPDAESEADIRAIVAHNNDGDTLFAGAADLFTALLQASLPPAINSASSQPRETKPPGTSTLILCGSTQSRPLDVGIAVSPMPIEIYEGSSDLSRWNTQAYDASGSLILAIPHTHLTGKTVAVHLRTVMAQMARRLVDQHCPDHLIIEGGATAWATLQALGWTQFAIVHQYAPGVVSMQTPSGTIVTLKPGSYPWGPLFKSGDSG